MSDKYTPDNCPDNRCSYVLEVGKNRNFCCSSPSYPKHSVNNVKYCSRHFEKLTRGNTKNKKVEDCKELNQSIHISKFMEDELNNIKDENEDILVLEQEQYKPSIKKAPAVKVNAVKKVVNKVIKQEPVILKEEVDENDEIEESYSSSNVEDSYESSSISSIEEVKLTSKSVAIKIEPSKPVPVKIEQKAVPVKQDKKKVVNKTPVLNIAKPVRKGSLYN